MWFVGKRVVLARLYIEEGGGEHPDKLTGTITALFDPRTVFATSSRTGGRWVTSNCNVRWDGEGAVEWWQNTYQLEPIIPDSDASHLTVEQLLQLGEEQPA